MGSGFRDLVACDILRIFRVGEVNDVQVTTHPTLNAPFAGRRVVALVVCSGAFPGRTAPARNFVSQEEVELPGRHLLVWKSRVCRANGVGDSRDKYRMFDRASPLSIAHVHDHHASLPFR